MEMFLPFFSPSVRISSFCVSRHMSTHLPQPIHLDISLVIDKLVVSIASAAALAVSDENIFFPNVHATAIPTVA
jgi:hypothetical protein